VTDSKNCSATASNNVGLTTNPVPITLDRIVNVKCNGQNNGEIDVTVGNGTFTYNYAWNPTGQNTEDAFNLSAGSYTLTATDQNGCVDSASFVVTEPAVLALNPNAQTDVTCNGGNNGTATVSPTGGSGNYSYLWNDANNQTSATATGLIAGSYTVTVSDDSSCTTVTNFTINQPVAITFGASTTFDVKCNGGNNGSATVVPQNGVGGYQYIWNDPASQSSNPAVNLIAGSYDVTVSDIDGCTATTNVVITEPTLLQVQVSGTPITCFGANDGTASAVASGGVVATTYSYSWSNNGSTATIQGLMANTYTVTVQDDNLCTASGSYDVVEPTAIDLTVSATRTSCPTSSDGKVDVLFAGGTGTLTVNLTQNGTTLQSNNNGNFTGVPAGDYTIVVSDGNACSSNKNVTVPAAPFNFFNTAVDSTSCYGTQYKDGHIFVEGTTIDNAPYQYSVDGGAFTYDNDFYQLGAGQHTVTTKDNYGCDTTFTVIVPEPLPASVDILPDDSTLQVGSSLQLYGTLKPYPASSITSYQWSPAEGLSCIDCPNPVATPYHHINEYHLTITYNKGCTAESFVTVYVENNLPLYVPNAFSPNGDGNNDFYLIFGEGIKDLSLKIFNRWGELVFVSTNQQTAWDGRYKGELQPPGVYVYLVEVTYLDDKVVKKQGSLTLIR
jgi:gliding motility-associated-like protein